MKTVWTNTACTSLFISILLCHSIALSAPARLDVPKPPAAIQQQAGILLGSLVNGRLSTVDIALSRLVEMRKEAQIVNLTPVAAAFIGYFEQGTRDATVGERQALAEAAIELAPDYPYLYFNLARVRLSQGLEGIGPAIGSLIDGLKKVPVFPRTESILVANVSFYLIGVLLVLYIITGFAMLFRYLPLIRHDIGDMFPSAATAAFSASEVRKTKSVLFILGNKASAVFLNVLILIIALAPLVLGFGLLLTAALWLALAFPYCRKAEKALAIAVTLIVCILPVVGAVTGIPEHIQDSSGTLRWSCMREYCPESSQSALETLIHASDQEEPGDEATRAVTIVAVATGRLQYAGKDEAAIANVRILLSGQPDLMNSSAGLTLLGNALVMEAVASCPDGHPDRARIKEASKVFTKAVELRTGNEAALRGLAVAMGLTGRRDDMELALQKVLEITKESDLDFMARVRTSTAATDSCDRFTEIAGELRPPEPSSNRTIYYSGEKLTDLIQDVSAVIPYSSVLLSKMSMTALPYALGVTLFAGIVLAFLLPFSRRAYRCPRCRHVSCPSCNRRASDFDYCPVCMFDQVKPAFLDPRDVMVLRTDQVQGLVSRIGVPLLSFIIPGSGQLLDGKPFRGTLMLLLLGIGLEVVLYPVPPVVDSFAYIQPSAGGLPIAPPILLATAYLWSVLDVIISRRR
jgi:hypothetical protein